MEGGGLDVLAVPGGGSEGVKVYITRWALTRGILEADVFAAGGSDTAMLADGTAFFKGEWFPTLARAAVDFQERKLARLSKMRSQMAKLEERKPKVVKMSGRSKR